MLSEKFLATNLLAILPFYLSSIFVDVRTNPPLKVVLPPNSVVQKTPPKRESGDSSSSDWTISDSAYDRRSCLSMRTVDIDEPQCPFSSTWIPMHLAKTVRTVQGCKEAIWEQYKNIFSGLVVSNSGRPGSIVPQVASPREAFEQEWASWEKSVGRDLLCA